MASEEDKTPGEPSFDPRTWLKPEPSDGPGASGPRERSAPPDDPAAPTAAKATSFDPKTWLKAEPAAPRSVPPPPAPPPPSR
ncbi:MAG TPA: hypothetical protein VG939_07975, partial [Caulobacteraceae bacterium]|nr:hypothetical protein [Caulobacteraceae bacterium]